MKAHKFKKKAEKLINKFHNLIDKIPDKEHEFAQSQKYLLISALHELSKTINGINDSDFKINI